MPPVTGYRVTAVVGNRWLFFVVRTLTPERQAKKDWAIQLAGLGMTREAIACTIGEAEGTVKYWLWKCADIPNRDHCIVNQNGKIVHNDGTPVDNFHDGHPKHPCPQLFCGRAENLYFLNTESIDVIITSPPYNLGQEHWPMGGNGRTPREKGIGYIAHEDIMPESEYQEWQLAVFQELHRVARRGASFFYNHKVRQRGGAIIHPMAWVGNPANPWVIRQEIIWDRGSTHNHTTGLCWPQDERIYWMTKGKPKLPDNVDNLPSVWQFHGPVANTWHPAPFIDELPRRCLQLVGRPGITVLDPFGGSMTTCRVAERRAYKSIGVDISQEYIDEAWRRHISWSRNAGN